MNDAINRIRAAVGKGANRADRLLFSSAFGDLGSDASLLMAWSARAADLPARPLAAAEGTALLQTLWSRDKYMGRLGADAIARLGQFFDFAVVPAGRDIIEQDEYGDFMVVLLGGSIAVDRLQPWGEQLRMAEVRPGEMLGEMSLLDGGIRFARCTTLTDCRIAVLDAEALDRMMAGDPELAASLVALLARKLSLRLRAVGARVSDRQNP